MDTVTRGEVYMGTWVRRSLGQLSGKTRKERGVSVHYTFVNPFAIFSEMTQGLKHIYFYDCMTSRQNQN